MQSFESFECVEDVELSSDPTISDLLVSICFHRGIHLPHSLWSIWLALQVARRIIGAKGTNMKRLATRETRETRETRDLEISGPFAS